MIDGIRTFLAVLAMGSILAVGTAAVAGQAGDRLFTEGLFGDMAPGTRLVYDHRREGAGTGEGALPTITDGLVAITLRDDADGYREAIVEITAAGKTKSMNPYPASAGNPLLITFLESTLRAMAHITGGSPFYIRNRMKESFRSGGTLQPVDATFGSKTIDAEAITFVPFADDRNRHRMGDFADLELRFVRADAVPGGFLAFSARTPAQSDGTVTFRETIDLRTAQE